MSKIIVIGGGAAGFKAYNKIVQGSQDTKVTLFSEEETVAYERPMLSKEYLYSSETALRFIQPVSNSSNANVVLKTEIESIDRSRKQVVATDGRTYPYDKLIIATGSRPRKLSVDKSVEPYVHYVRNIADADNLRGALHAGKKVAIIGGGFIGLEIAAACIKAGAQPFVLEAQERLLSRSAPAHLSDKVQELHVRNGTVVNLSTSVESFEKISHDVVRVNTSHGNVDVHLVVIGIGIIPNVELAINCGLTVDNGIVVDSYCQTSDESIFAAGEVTSYPVKCLNIRTRSECWTVAVDQGGVAGSNVIGTPESEYLDVPWVWSDQFDVSIQCLGVPLAAKSSSVHLNDKGGWLQIGWSSADTIVGAIGYNANREVAELRRGFARGLPPPEKYLK